MLVNLFVAMMMLDGSTVYYRYPDALPRFECDKQAHIEAEKMRKQDTSDMQDVEFMCMTDQNFVRKYFK